MPNPSTGLRRKIWIAFILQAAAISFAAVLGVYGASAVLKHVLVKRALQEEAAHFWTDRRGDPARLPETFHLDAYLVEDADDRAALPAAMRTLEPGFHSLPRDEGGTLVLVDADEASGRTLLMAFRQQRLDDLAFWFGVVPLAIVLAVIYVIAWSTYRASRQAVSPVIWLAAQVKRWDPKNPESSVLKPENLPVDVEGETLVLASSLHDYASRLGSFVERERDFTRDASHELRTPLAVIRVAGDMMAGDENLSPMSRRALKRIQGAGRDMEALIEAFLIMAREEDTGLPDDDFAVGDILAEEIEKARVMLGAKPVKLEFVKNADFHLLAPSRVLSVLVGNLLRNASHHTDEGSITVTLDQGRVTIADTGVGMSADALSHAFEPYYGGDDRKIGQGLGLSIVQRLSRRFGWNVRLDSVPGRGTVATLTFPDLVPTG
jgi:signal transduction histidine kinase